MKFHFNEIWTSMCDPCEFGIQKVNRSKKIYDLLSSDIVN